MRVYVQARGSRRASADGGDDDGGADDLQTVMWTRALAGLDRHNVEGCEDLLDTYFTQASKHALLLQDLRLLRMAGSALGACKAVLSVLRHSEVISGSMLRSHVLRLSKVLNMLSHGLSRMDAWSG